MVSYPIQSDITGRKGHEEALLTTELRWRSIFENSAVGIALTDPKGFYIVTNRAFQELVGYTDEELRALSYVDITYEDDRPNNVALCQELWNGKRQQFTHEKRYRRKDGNLIWVRSTVSLAADNETAPRFGMGIAEDITERKNAEQQLRRSEAYLAAGQRLSHTGSWALNVSSGELFWSQETFRIFGLDPATVIPSVEIFLRGIHPEDRPRIEHGIKQAPTEPRDYAADYRIVLPDGSTKYVRDVVYPVTNEAGQVIERYGLVMDVTERKLAEKKLQNSFEQLRALAARLQTVREEESKRIAFLIHDELGSALTTLGWDLEGIRALLSKSETGPHLQVVLDKLKFMGGVVENTLNAIRQIASELRPPILDVLGLAAAIELQADQFQARTGIVCSCDWSVSVKDIALKNEQSTAVFRIFQEAMTNILRHARATKVNIAAKLEDTEFVLTITDNGKGISDPELSNQQSLGLAGMRERAHLIGGTVEVARVAETGTIVSVRIPPSAWAPADSTRKDL